MARTAMAMIVAGAIAAPVCAQSPRGWPTSLDFSVGTSTAWGGDYSSRAGTSVAVTIVPDHRDAATFAIGVGYATSGGNGDLCALSSIGACRERFPATYHVSALLGASYRVGVATVRALAGPAVVFGDGVPGVGPQGQADIAVGGTHLELVLGYRASAARRSSGQWQGLGAGMFGVRIH